MKAVVSNGEEARKALSVALIFPSEGPTDFVKDAKLDSVQEAEVIKVRLHQGIASRWPAYNRPSRNKWNKIAFSPLPSKIAVDYSESKKETASISVFDKLEATRSDQLDSEYEKACIVASSQRRSRISTQFTWKVFSNTSKMSTWTRRAPHFLTSINGYLCHARMMHRSSTTVRACCVLTLHFAVKLLGPLVSAFCLSQLRLTVLFRI